MDAADKVKVALDESRMLILGAQVLLGFQLRGAFETRFDQLADHVKIADAISLMLMVVVIGLLIAPAIHHRLVEDGNATTRILRLISVAMACALLPFAVSLGLNVFVATERFAGSWAIMPGIGSAGLALWFWYGMEWLAVVRKGGKPMKPINEEIPLSKKIDQMRTEARVILPGAQALLGFQLAVMLTDPFEKLSSLSIITHAL